MVIEVPVKKYQVRLHFKHIYTNSHRHTIKILYSILGGATLIFEVELIKIERKEEL